MLNIINIIEKQKLFEVLIEILERDFNQELFDYCYENYHQEMVDYFDKKYSF